MNHLITITKSDGTRQLFEEEKLVGSLKRVGASPEVIESVVEEVERGMTDGMPTHVIYTKAFELLKRHSAPVAIKYSLRRALIELGPDGFPFEKFVARAFKMWGYEAVTDQILRGECVDHEIDVVAWKNEGLAMVEAKFHNEFGLKSDLKVVLYVKARYDDLANVEFNYGGEKRKLTERWLVTNTKFTDKAIMYGSCQNLKLVGWNYPDKGNLHQLIEQNGLHPITCITGLTAEQKRNLISQGILICSDLASNLDALRNIGVHDADIASIIKEIEVILATAK